MIPPKLFYGDNIFAFAQKVEKTINQPLLFEELKRLYSGEAIKVKNVQTKNIKIATCEIRYNRKKSVEFTGSSTHRYPQKVNQSTSN